LIVVCGLPGVGKTTVAERIADRLDARLLRTDVVRKERHPDPDYTGAETEAVYDEVVDRAGAVAAAGEHVVVDGTFRERRYRRRAAEAAEAAGAGFRIVKVECDEGIVRERIESRTDDASDADYGVHELLRTEFDPVTADHATVDNSDDPGETAARVEQLF
jgi:hypothetical protein